MLKIPTPCFVEGGWIPDYNAGFGEDQSPEFHIEGIAPKAETMVITLDDLGHPLEPGYNHWVAWNIKPADCIPGGIPKGSVIETPIHIEQGIAYGKHCYRGPKPPFNWNHVAKYYLSHKDEFETVRAELSTCGVEYPVMKLMDMCMWQVAFEADN